MHKAIASAFSALGGRGLLTLEAGKGTCGSTSGSQGREHHYPQTQCLCVAHALKRALPAFHENPLEDTSQDTTSAPSISRLLE